MRERMNSRRLKSHASTALGRRRQFSRVGAPTRALAPWISRSFAPSGRRRPWPNEFTRNLECVGMANSETDLRTIALPAHRRRSAACVCFSVRCAMTAPGPMLNVARQRTPGFGDGPIPASGSAPQFRCDTRSKTSGQRLAEINTPIGMSKRRWARACLWWSQGNKGDASCPFDTSRLALR